MDALLFFGGGDSALSRRMSVKVFRPFRLAEATRAIQKSRESSWDSGRSDEGLCMMEVGEYKRGRAWKRMSNKYKVN